MTSLPDDPLEGSHSLSDNPQTPLQPPTDGSAGVDDNSISQPEHDFNFGDELDDGVDDETISSRDRVLFCFRCHREDRHFHGLRSRSYYNLLLGFSLGAIYLIGPFRCRCCGGWRMMCHDLLSPRFWWQSLNSGAKPSRQKKS